MCVNLTMLSKGRKTQKTTGYTLPWSSKSGKNNLCSSFGYIQRDFWGNKEDSEVLIMCWFLFWVPLTLMCSLCKISSSCTSVVTDVCVIHHYKFFMKMREPTYLDYTHFSPFLPGTQMWCMMWNYEVTSMRTKNTC